MDYGTNNIQFSGGKLFCFICWANFPRRVIEDHNQYDRIEKCDWFTGCCWLVPASIFLEIGLFDDSFFAYDEDLDFCIRARKAGYDILFCPFARIWHKGGMASGGRLSPKACYLDNRNRIKLVFKHADMLQKAIFFILYIPIMLSLFIIMNRIYLIKPFFLSFVSILTKRNYYGVK